MPAGADADGARPPGPERAVVDHALADARDQAPLGVLRDGGGDREPLAGDHRAAELEARHRQAGQPRAVAGKDLELATAVAQPERANRRPAATAGAQPQAVP